MATPLEVSAANECGVGPVVVCPVGLYPGGVRYTLTGDFDLSLADGAAVAPTYGLNGVEVWSQGQVAIRTGAGSTVSTSGDTIGVLGVIRTGTLELDIQSVEVTRPVLGTSGYSYGVYAASTHRGDVAIHASQVSVSGRAGAAVVGRAYRGGTVDIAAGVTNFDGDGVVISGGSQAYYGAVAITSEAATGTAQFGIVASAYTTASVVSEVIEIGGPAGHGAGIWINSLDSLSVTSGRIVLTGPSMTGIQASTGGPPSIDECADVIAEIGYCDIPDFVGGDISIASDEILTGTGGSRGIYAETIVGDITIDAGTTHTNNLGAVGVDLADAIGAVSSHGGLVTITSDDASAAGAGGSAIRGLSTGGRVVIDSGKARAISDGRQAILAQGDSVSVTSQDAEITGANAAAIRVIGVDGDVVVVSGRAVANGGGGTGLDILASHDATVTITGETSGELNGASISALHRSNVTLAAGASVRSTTGVGLVFKTRGIIGSPTTAVSAGYGADLTTAGHLAGGDGFNAVQFGDGNDSLTVLGSARIDGAVDAGAGQDALILKGAGQVGAQTLGGLLGFETALIESGEFILAQDTHFDSTTITGGKLKINGSVTSDVTVGAGGALGGSGLIGGDVVVQGQVTPGNSPGTLTVAGDFTFAAGSTYQVEVLPTGEHDLIVVGGGATIQTGAKVAVLAGGPASQYARLSQYGILTSAGGITGRFSSVTSDLAFLTPTLTYTTNAVRLNLVRNDIRFASFAATSNQARVADAAEALGLGAPVYDALITQNAAGSAQAYAALDGQIYADVSTVLAGDAGRMREAVRARALAPAEVTGGWGDVLAGWSRVDAGAGAAGLKASSAGLVVGGDTMVGSTRLGVAAAYGEGQASVSARASRAEAASGQVATYAASAFGPLRAHLGGAYAWSSIDAERVVLFPGSQDRLKGKYDATVGQVFGQVSTPLTLGAATVEPFAAASYLRVKSDDFSETGGFAALQVDGVTRQLGVIDLGVKLKGEFGLGSAVAFRPRGAIAWRMATGDLAGQTSNAFTGGTTRFVVSGAKTDAAALALQLGADLVSGDRARFGVTYDGTFGDRFEAQAIRAGGAWRF